MIPQHLTLTQYQGRRVHVGISGSIAAYKAIDVCRALQATGIETSAVLTAAGARFITKWSLGALGVNPVQTSMFSRDDSIFAHLEPGQNASLMLVLPATANTMAKLAAGIADNMLTCQALAFPGPLLIVPAMNPNLWLSPATEENVARLSRRENVRIMQPESGEMACGDLGRGKLPPLLDIYFQALKSLSKQDLSGLKVLISLGPTREFFDPVRFWSNPSSGMMGAALAVTAWIRGAEVRCVCGPTDVWLPGSVERQDVITAREMHEACLDCWPDFDIGCLCAAVSDFRPKTAMTQKFKKASASGFSVEFDSNPDILKALGENKRTG
ncbi:MAG: bifunctional phosphopantothenoylcysteine decarboxylase/phosphopantothenate--cysteine ligase CoaBC, partial [Thermodesulfobacteriota bacterium]